MNNSILFDMEEDGNRIRREANGKQLLMIDRRLKVF